MGAISALARLDKACQLIRTPLDRVDFAPAAVR